MREHSVFGLAAAFALFVFTPTPAQACACCADPGYRAESRSAPTAYEKEQLNRVRLAATAELHTTDADDSVKGIDDAGGSYQVSRSVKGGKWVFTFRSSNRKSGILTLAAPKALDRFAVDPQDGAQSSGGGPVLYKEWRFGGAVTGTGIFANGLSKGATAKLVLQGRGNVCDEAEAFSHWMLIVSGPNAKYTLFGKLGAPSP